ncbi:FtsK/SpoIIIE domain-containing protein [Tsukamurella sp. NPDC003166]|uniref:FtsK/SpoIIIE domain-containing protein n=1 Tax=Tsukamurella sp. NPDC003166 TaxID=3154444 RepID=UPI0033A78C1D
MAKAIVDEYAAAHLDIGASVSALESARSDLCAAYDHRFGEGTSRYMSGHAGAVPFGQWIEAAGRITSRLLTASVPWTDKGRKQLATEMRELTSGHLSSYDATRRKLCVDAWHQMAKDGGQRALRHQPQMRTGRAGAVPKPPIGPPDTGFAETVVPGAGPLNVYLGMIRPAGLTFSSSSVSDYESTTHTAALAPAEIPVVIDLDSAGGVIVSDPLCIETAVLNLLAALPANQLAIRVFDQKRSGDSAKFLYGLGDATEKVLGGLPATSERQLEELLQNTEEHITFVTQRFLQGEHHSLTEYNRAAGEVAEAYRLLILYDFPAGFSRSGHEDVDQLARLARVIQNGPRCGVFTVLVAPNMGVHGQFLDMLPRFFSGQLVPDSVLSKMRSWSGLDLPRVVSAPATRGTVAKLSSGAVSWKFDGARAPKPDVASALLDSVKRSLATADDVKVTPERVLELAAQEERNAAATLRVLSMDRTPDIYRPETWWRGTSTDRVAAHFGRVGARQVADLVIDSEVNSYAALIGGRPGSGKSVLIHAMIMSLALEYSPSELELFLIDFKEGVEFKQYADVGLPQARLIAIEAERDFGLSVLERAQDEYKTRGEKFKAVGAVKVSEYRERTGRVLSRYVVIIDEFQQLFSQDDRLAQDAALVLEDLLRKGRAFGIHVVLASQSLAGMAALGKHVIGLIPTRIALQSNEADSRLILGEENPDAQTLSRAGEGILNLDSGRRDLNKRFQAALWEPELRAAVLAQVVERAMAEGFDEPTAIFEGHRAAPVGGLDPGRLAVVDEGIKKLGLPLGLPLLLDPDPHREHFQRVAGSNLLMIDEQGAGTLAVLLASLALRGVAVDLVDYAADDENWTPVVEELEYFPGITVERRRGMRALLNGLADTVNDRHETNCLREPARVLVIAGMGRARDFDPGNYDDDSATRVLGRILQDGPEAGVHTILWFESAGAVRKRMGGDQINECGLRMIGPMGRDESSELADTPDGASLKSGQAIIADVDRSRSTKVRRFAPPPPGWLQSLNRSGARV